MTTTTQDSISEQPEPAEAPLGQEFRAYGVAVIATGLTFVLRWMLGYVMGDLPVLILFVIPIAISSYKGGLGPGLLATALGAAGSLYYVLPDNSFNTPGLANGMLWMMLIVAGVLISFFSEALHRSRRHLEDNGNLLSVTLTSIGDAVITTDLLGEILFINWEASRLTGYPADEAIGLPLRTVFRAIHDHTRQPVEDPVQKVLRGGAEIGITRDILLLARDGTEIPIEESCAPIREQNGPLQGVVVVFSDRTLKRQAEGAIQDRLRMQEQLMKIAATAPGVIHEFQQRPDGSVCFPYATARIEEIYGLRPQDLSSDASAAMQRIHPDDLERLNRGIAESAQRMNPWRAEFRVRNPQRGEIWVEGHSTPQRQPDGSIRWYGFLNDITERKAAEEKLERATEHLHAALRAGGMGTWEWDLTGSRATWDRSIDALLGREFHGTPEEAVAFFVSCVHPDDRPTLERAMQASYAGSDFNTEYRVVHPDGTHRWLAARGLLRREADTGRLRMVGACVDITQHKQMESDLASAKEAAEASNRAKDLFLAMLSHELRTPLTPVLLLASSAEHDSRLHPELKEDLAVIRDAQAEARLIDDLLDLTRIALGKFSLQIADCDVHAQLLRAIEVCREEAETRGQRIECELNAEHFHVSGDPQRLLQVFWNLVQNASKYSGDHGRIIVRTRNAKRASSTPPGTIAPAAFGVDALPQRDPAGELLVIEFQDNGIGIPAASMQRIFEPFEQPHRTLQNGVGGIGLGLTISKAIVEAHAGALRVESCGPDRGATFTIQLLTAPASAPARDAAPPSVPAPPVALPPAAPMPHRTRRVLLVEDHVMTARNLQRLIQTDGFEVRIAADIASARKLLDSEPFDVLLTDLGLPDGDGTELMRHLRARGMNTRGIVLSGYGMDTDLQRTREAGFEAHLVKPITADQLSEALKNVIA